MLEAINHPHVPSVEEQLLQFIIGVKGKYSAYSQHIQNDMIEVVAAPATIAEAEHEAEHWRQDISSSNTSRLQNDTPRGAFVTTGTEKNAKKFCFEKIEFKSYRKTKTCKTATDQAKRQRMT